MCTTCALISTGTDTSPCALGQAKIRIIENLKSENKRHAAVEAYNPYSPAYCICPRCTQVSSTCMSCCGSRSCGNVVDVYDPSSVMAVVGVLCVRVTIHSCRATCQPYLTGQGLVYGSQCSDHKGTCPSAQFHGFPPGRGVHDAACCCPTLDVLQRVADKTSDLQANAEARISPLNLTAMVVSSDDQT